MCGIRVWYNARMMVRDFLKFCSVAVALGGGLWFSPAQAESVIDLAGEWDVVGSDVRGKVHLPGTLADAKLGTEFKAEDWAKMTDRRTKGALMRHYQYLGKAVYSREFRFGDDELKAVSRGGALELVLGRVMWRSEVSIDGRPLGGCDFLAAPHRYAIPAALVTPGTHRIEIAVDNSNQHGFSEWSHAYGPVMQTVWHGIRGEVSIREKGVFDAARIFAEADGSLRVDRAPAGTVVNVRELAEGEKPLPWSPEHPKLYTAVLKDPASGATREIRFGYRTISTDGKRLVVNGQPFFVRGNVENCHFPLTGAPAMDVDAWRRIMRIHREEGFNAIRFHSWCPPAAAFEAADEVGVFLMPEAGIWADGWNARGVFPGRGTSMDGFLQREFAAILANYGNSPSFFSLAIGNEFATGDGGCDWEVMNGWMRGLKAEDPRRLYMIASGRGYVPGDEFVSCGWVPEPGDCFAHQIWGHLDEPWPYTDYDWEKGFSKAHVPQLRHEVGQWAVFPLREEVAKYTGVLKAYDREEFVRRLDAAGLAGWERRFHDASAKLSRILYKDDVEAYLRTPSCAGFEMLSMQDFSGQGEALVGWLDSFYDPKPGFANAVPLTTVMNARPCLARFSKCVWRAGETFEAALEVRNLGETAIPAGTRLPWRFADAAGEAVLAEPLRPFELRRVGAVRVALTEKALGKRTLVFGDNRWDIWVLPDERPAAVPEGVVLTEDAATAAAALAKGGRVIYTGESRRSGVVSFRPVFWTAAWFPPARGHHALMGSCVDASHPALRGFPTEDWTDFQWARIMDGAKSHLLEGLPAGYEPIVRGVCDFHNPGSVASLFEMSVGKGRLLVCGYDLAKADPASVRMRNALFGYVASDAFKPRFAVAGDWFATAFGDAGLASARPRPPEFAKAPLYIEAAVGYEGGVGTGGSWRRFDDRAELPGGSYCVKGGVWRDELGTYWHGSPLRIEFRGLPALAGRLRLRFRDPNRLGRTGVGTFEGRRFEIPRHDGNDERSVWVEVVLQREDALDGVMKLELTPKTGPNLMLDRVVIVTSAVPAVGEPKPKDDSADIRLAPGDVGKDAVAAVMRAVREAHAKGGGTVRLADGTYHFHAASATKMSYHVSNHDQPAAHPVFLPFVGVTNVALVARNARFVMHGKGTAILLNRTEGVTFRGITVEWEKPYFARAEIVGFAEGRTRVRFPERDRVSVRNGRLVLSGEDWENALRIGTVFDRKTHAIVERSKDVYFSGKGREVGNREFLIDVDLSRAGAGAKVGDVYVIRSFSRPHPAICLDRAKDTRFENFVFRDGFGMGILAQLSENVTLRGGGCYPRDRSEYCANTVDATHFSNCRGTVTVEGCRFEGMMDDALNVHSTSLAIVGKPSADSIRCRYMHEMSVGLGVFAPGDAVRFIAGKTLENGAVGRVKAVETHDAREITLVLEQPIPAGYGVGDAVENADWQCAVTFRDNVVANNRARGVLFTTPHRIVCEGNFFDRVSGSAILLAGDAQGWYESGACEDVVIRRNRFRDCLTSSFQYCDGLVSIHPEVKDLTGQKRRYHRNILIEDNDIETFDVTLLFALSAEDVTWRNNRVKRHSRYQAWNKPPFVLQGCERVTTD